MRRPFEKTLSNSRLDLMVLSMGLDGQLLTALGAAAREDGTAALGCHASAEAMGLGALPLVGLIRTLHV